MKIKLLLALLLVPFALVGCNSGGGGDTPTPTPTSKVISLKQNKFEIRIGETCQLEPILSNPKMLVFYESKDETIAQVDDNGLVSAISQGTTIIYAKCGTDTALAEIDVKGAQVKYDLSIEMPQDEYLISLEEDFLLPISSKVNGQEVEATLTYEIVDPTILSINDDYINPIKAGTTKVIITANYETLEAKKTISITIE